MRIIAWLSLLAFAGLTLWARGVVSATAAPAPTQPSAIELLNPQLEGAFIELQVQPLRPDLWTRIQWQDARGDWHTVDGWQGTFNADQRVLWYVGAEHLQEGPFRWLVYADQTGPLLATSRPFDLPSRGEILRVVATLPATTPTVAAVAPWVRAHPVWDAVDAWAWPRNARLHLTVNDPTTPLTPDLELDMPGAFDPELGSVWFEFAGVYDLKPGDEVTLSDGATTRRLVVAALSIVAVDAAADTASGTAAAGVTVRLPAPPPPDKALFVTADKDGRWRADFHAIDFDLLPGAMVIAEVHDADGDLTSFEWQIPTLLSENVAAGRPVSVTTNGADDARENPGVNPADITDRRLNYLPAGDGLEDGVVGYVNDDYNEPLVITVTIDLGGVYDVMRIRYTMGDVQRAETWNADRMTTPFDVTSTNPGAPGRGVWTEHSGRATLSQVTIVLEKTRRSYAGDWLFIGEIEVYGVPGVP
jgi:hypothetical protein